MEDLVAAEPHRVLPGGCRDGPDDALVIELVQDAADLILAVTSPLRQIRDRFRDLPARGVTRWSNTSMAVWRSPLPRAPSAFPRWAIDDHR